ncbi:hypothetical protein PLICRDRAFT_45303 [Plicaturopsis crispa FD-325 SS-3]|uniref:glutathione transferase n=1 Tax=Plicaturopsis crispa FD-325 SS-3 TaxID=944288 RepID=A0A0C9SS02_PLICR|nr:hypothetical protein PLICRDRAFT_45303 [Plicaturopsis crispa FD-325 SS-3]
MVLKLHGVSASICTRRAAIAFKEKNVPYELIPVNMAKGEHKSPEHLAYQPFGQIPYLDDDGFILYESRAITRYIAEKYASQGTQGLIPTDLKAKALFEQAVSTELCDFNPPTEGIFYETVVKPIYGLTKDDGRVAEYTKSLLGKLDGYERVLSKQKYLAGNEITLADLWHLPYGAALKKSGIDVLEDTSRPNVARWWKELIERPSWKAVENGA